MTNYNEDFWNAQGLGEIDGSPSKSFVEDNFTVVPHGTTALAQIKNFQFITKASDNVPFHKITWKLIDGEFKGALINQKLHTFSPKESKRFRNLNMLRLLYNLYNITNIPKGTPDNPDLAIFVGKIAGIRINEFPKDDGSTGNWVSEIHKGSGFQSVTGPGLKESSKKTNNVEHLSVRPPLPPIPDDPSEFDDEIPF